MRFLVKTMSLGTVEVEGGRGTPAEIRGALANLAGGRAVAFETATQIGSAVVAPLPAAGAARITTRLQELAAGRR